MGWFDWFRKPKPVAARPLSPAACYDIAYLVLPRYAFNELDRLAEMVRKSPEAVSLAFYTIGCQRRGSKLDPGAASRLVWHISDLDARRECFLAYPPPPPGRNEMDPMPFLRDGVLVPYFSAIVRDKATDERSYFVLGQSPLGGRTTLRCVTRDGMNCNLGPGPAVEKEAFLDCIRLFLARRG